MEPKEKARVLAGRRAVDAYHKAHCGQLHRKPWHRGVPAEHTPLLNKLLEELKRVGFKSLQEFEEADEALAAREGEEV